MSQWSHAGGVVVRTIDGEPEYLLVEASDQRDIWVLPKGRIEKGGTPEAAAVRALAWRRYDDALGLLHFDNTRRVLTQARALHAKKRRGEK